MSKRLPWPALFICTWLILSSTLVTTAQSVHSFFGRNRVQYKTFDWSYIQTEHFNIYYYSGGKDLAYFISQSIENDLKEVEEKLQYRVLDKVDILLYSDLSDLHQNNIGITSTTYNIGGTAKFPNKKVFVYFDGNHVNLHRQLKEGIARVFLKDMLYRGEVQDVIQNVIFLNLPEWFTEGITSYVGGIWSTYYDNKIKDGIFANEFRSLSSLSGEEARIVGHSFWNYIGHKYGKSAIINLLYLTRVNHNIESGFPYVTGISVKDLFEEWKSFYAKKYSESIEDKFLPGSENELMIETKSNWRYYDLKTDPYGRFLAFVSNNNGRFKIMLYNKASRSVKVLEAGGNKRTDQALSYNSPNLSWSPNGKELVYIFEEKDKHYLVRYDPFSDTENRKELKTVEQVIDFSHINDGSLVLSATNRGQADIYIMDVFTCEVSKITSDLYDDLTPAYLEISDKKGIIFSSNRPHAEAEEDIQDIYALTSFNLFFYDYDTRKFTQLTFDDQAREIMPLQYDDRHFTFLSDQNGIYNRFIGTLGKVLVKQDTLVYKDGKVKKNPVLDKRVFMKVPNKYVDSFRVQNIYEDGASVFPVTNYSRSILEQDIAKNNETLVELIYKYGAFHFYEVPVNSEINPSSSVKLTPARIEVKKVIADKDSTIKETPKTKKEEPVDSAEEEKKEYPYHFQPEYQFPEDTLTKSETTPEGQYQNQAGPLPNSKKYKTRMATDLIVSQFDNSILFTPYQQFSGEGSSFIPQGLNPLIKFSITDIFEDFRFTGGIRIPTNLSGNEYFLSFENLKRRLDKKILFYRKNDLRGFDIDYEFPIPGRVKTTFVEGTLSWPFSESASIRAAFGYRMDKFVFIPVDTFTLRLPNIYDNWGSMRLSYVYDNTIPLDINVMEGVKFKVFTEFQRQLYAKGGYIITPGTEVRYYKKIKKQIIWANRAAIGKSLGSRKILYYMGGVDNWLFPQFNSTLGLSQNDTYAFQALVTNVRGFVQNSRNGSAYAVANTELRVPIFKYLNLFSTSRFFYNLQFIGFSDIGTAWSGPTPFSDKNPINQQTLVNKDGNVTAKVNFTRGPFIGGVGTGIRSVILEHFVRADVAWGYQSGVFNKKPVFYFSIGLDF